MTMICPNKYASKANGYPVMFTARLEKDWPHCPGYYDCTDFGCSRISLMICRLIMKSFSIAELNLTCLQCCTHSLIWNSFLTCYPFYLNS